MVPELLTPAWCNEACRIDQRIPVEYSDPQQFRSHAIHGTIACVVMCGLLQDLFAALSF